MITAGDTQGRLLPWANDGKPCFLRPDGDSQGVLSQLADDVEDAQLAMGHHELSNARKVLDDPTSPNASVRYAAIRLAECLTDALRVAESRGLRLPVPDDEDAENAAQKPAEALR